MTVNKYLMPILAIAALVATVFVARLTGDWIVSGKDIPLGDMTAADLKGWMTLQNVSDGLNIPLPEVYRLAGIPAGLEVPAETALKDLEKLVEGFETSVLREAAEVYLAGDAAPAPVQAEPVAASETPAAAATATPPVQPTQTPAAAETPHVPQGDGSGDGSGTGPTPLPPGQVLPAAEIKGRMTLQEIAEQSKVDLAALLEALGLPADTSPSMQVKTLVEEGKVAEVQTIRDAVAGLQK